MNDFTLLLTAIAGGLSCGGVIAIAKIVFPGMARRD